MINSFMWVPNTDLISKLEEDYNKADKVYFNNLNLAQLISHQQSQT